MGLIYEADDAAAVFQPHGTHTPEAIHPPQHGAGKIHVPERSLKSKFVAFGTYFLVNHKQVHSSMRLVYEMVEMSSDESILHGSGCSHVSFCTLACVPQNATADSNK